jgi:hypothetical protein
MWSIIFVVPWRYSSLSQYIGERSNAGMMLVAGRRWNVTKSWVGEAGIVGFMFVVVRWSVVTNGSWVYRERLLPGNLQVGKMVCGWGCERR